MAVAADNSITEDRDRSMIEKPTTTATSASAIIIRRIMGRSGLSTVDLYAGPRCGSQYYRALISKCHVWTAPAVQEESDISAKRSGAAMYPAFECSRYGRWP